MKRFHALVSVAAQDLPLDQRFVVVTDLLRLPAKPSRSELLDLFADEARRAFARKGHPAVELDEASVIHLFELPDPPKPPADGRPPRNWRVEIDFVCHDVKFGSSASGVFRWPAEPKGAVLVEMQRVLMAGMLAVRGDGPDYAEYSDVVRGSVKETDAPPTHE